MKPFRKKAKPGPEEKDMAFFNSAITVLQILVIALGTGLGVWGVVNLLEGYGNDNPRIVLIRGKIQPNMEQV